MRPPKRAPTPGLPDDGAPARATARHDPPANQGDGGKGKPLDGVASCAPSLRRRKLEAHRVRGASRARRPPAAAPPRTAPPGPPSARHGVPRNLRDSAQPHGIGRGRADKGEGPPLAGPARALPEAVGPRLRALVAMGAEGAAPLPLGRQGLRDDGAAEDRAQARLAGRAGEWTARDLPTASKSGRLTMAKWPRAWPSATQRCCRQLCSKKSSTRPRGCVQRAVKDRPMGAPPALALHRNARPA